tara:strand:- start:3227 stop:3460 length:234 start_codon:yes stop_codon:yes gene_type:complete
MIDAVIVTLEVHVTTPNPIERQYIVLNFIDITPDFKKVDTTLKAIKESPEVKIVHHEFTYQKITEETDLKEYEITWH